MSASSSEEEEDEESLELSDQGSSESNVFGIVFSAALGESFFEALA